MVVAGAGVVVVVAEAVPLPFAQQPPLAPACADFIMGQPAAALSPVVSVAEAV